MKKEEPRDKNPRQKHKKHPQNRQTLISQFSHTRHELQSEYILKVDMTNINSNFCL